MRYTSGPSFGEAAGGFRATPWVKRLLFANAAVFLVTVAVGLGPMADLFAFSPGRLFERPWGMLTYMFVHAGLWHLLMNLLVLFFFGPPLESRWGSDFFVKFYVICGLGGVLMSFAFADAVIVGASAACYGVMLAFAMTWPDAPIHIWGVVPVRAKWVVGFLAALSLVSAIGPSRDGVAHLAHLGGVVTGLLVMKSGWVPALWGDVGTTGRRGTGHGKAGRGGGKVWTASRAWGTGGGGANWRSGLEAMSARLATLVDRMKAGGASSGPEGERRSRPGSATARPGAGGKVRAGKAGAGRQARGRQARERVSPVRRSEVRAIPMPPVGARRRSTAEERAELDALDAVLDKISEGGMGSLTNAERELLDRVSRRERTN